MNKKSLIDLFEKCVSDRHKFGRVLIRTPEGKHCVSNVTEEHPPSLLSVFDHPLIQWASMLRIPVLVTVAYSEMEIGQDWKGVDNDPYFSPNSSKRTLLQYWNMWRNIAFWCNIGETTCCIEHSTYSVRALMIMIIHNNGEQTKYHISLPVKCTVSVTSTVTGFSNQNSFKPGFFKSEHFQYSL